MKIIIIILCLFPLQLLSQPTQKEWEEFQEIFNYTVQKLDDARDSVRLLNQVVIKKDSVISTDLEIRGKDSVTIMNLNALNEIYKNEATKVVIPPIVSFAGFYPGLSVYYPFDDSVLTKQTILDGLKYDITAAFKFSIMNKVDLTGLIGIPLRKEKFYIKLNTEWRLF